VILGGGESGTGAAILAKKHGYSVFLSDYGSIKEKYKEMLSEQQITWEEGKHTQTEMEDATEVVKSPGIPESSPIVSYFLEQGIPVISEIEFAARYTTGKLIGITGTNGKTTTTLLTYHILKNAGMSVGIAGNVGQSLALQLASGDKDFWVLELSSFQLDGMFETKLDIAVLLNITPDHLDRYGYELQNYIDSKLRIIQNHTSTEAFIYWTEDESITTNLHEKGYSGRAYPFSLSKPTDSTQEGAYLDHNQLIIHLKSPLKMSIQDLALQGRHNIMNSMAASITGKLLDLRNESIRTSLTDFDTVEHRLEFVSKINGVKFINDSKATNVNSAWYALESQIETVIWIVGGVDKGNDYTDLIPLVESKVKAIICLGTDNKKLIETFGDKVKFIHEASTAKEAVDVAYQVAFDGETVLLSPACSSFDLFENYEDRGRQFKKAVKGL
jgi:UDP-N-acetylmuramoylalanine--D-glutamate ligase